MARLTNVPLAVILLICRRLGVHDIISLGLTCKRLRVYTCYRPIWLCAMQSVLAVVPAPLHSSYLRTMSTEKLLKYTHHAVCLHDAWQTRDAALRRIWAKHCSVGCRAMALLPGGAWVTGVLADGTVFLQKAKGDVVFLPPLARDNYESFRVSTALTSSLQMMVLVELTTAMIRKHIAVYHAALRHGKLTLISSYTGYDGAVLQGDMLALKTYREDKRITLRLISLPAHQPEMPEWAPMTLGPYQSPELVGISILSAGHLLVADGATLTVYAIPPLNARSQRYPRVIWSRACRSLFLPPVSGPIYWDSPARTHTRPLAFCGPRGFIRFAPTPDGDPARAVLTLMQLPPGDAPRVLDGDVPLLGVRRGAWFDRAGGRVVLYTMPGPRLGGGHADAVRVGSVAVSLGGRVVEALAFDEESGRICMMVGALVGGRAVKQFVFIDMV